MARSFKLPFMRASTVFLLAVALLVVGPLEVVVAVGFELTVVHTNDVRARFDPVSARQGRECTPELEAQGDCFGGLARRVTVIKELRDSAENTLLLDAGGQFQGSMWFYVNRGLATAHFMNELSYDAMALGQHEFDFGVEGLATFLSNLTFPALASNINLANEPSLDGLLAKQHIVTFANGQRVGIVGYIYQDLPNIVNTGELSFSEELEGLQPAVDSLLASGVNKIIALGHSGYEKALDIADKLVGVDVVVSGRDFTLLYTGAKPSTETPKGEYPKVVHPAHQPSATVLVVQAYAYGKYVGNLSVSFDDEGAVVGYGGNSILLDDSVVKDNETLREMEPWRNHVTEVANTVVGRTLVPLDVTACDSSECTAGNLVTDAMLFPNLNGTEGWSDVSIAITTTGSLLSSIDIGDVTIGALNGLLPYGDSIDIVELQGRHLLESLENSVFELDEENSNGQLMQMSGIKVVYDLNREPGHRVLNASVRCAQCLVPDYDLLDLNAVYKIAVNNYIASGKYGYTSLKENRISNSKGGLDADILKSYLETYSPVSHSVELGRQGMYHGDAPCFANPVGSSASCLKVPVLGLACAVGILVAFGKDW